MKNYFCKEDLGSSHFGVAERVTERVEEEIIAGRLMDGLFMHSVRDMCVRFNISDKTAMRALHVFREDEMLEVVKGRGWRIALGTRGRIIEKRREAMNVKFAAIYKEADFIGWWGSEQADRFFEEHGEDCDDEKSPA